MTAQPHGSRKNRLARETSPYLLQHAGNPVDWYPWGEEAFAKARAEDKPIFLSIGYSTCHWCHVMERESFENEGIARYLNENFVSIKVDREERPEVDEIYMTALTHVFGRGGGWPLSMWLTPELKPFFGGTYFPPEDRWGHPGFLTVLSRVHDAWTRERDTLRRDSEEVTRALESVSRNSAAGEVQPGAYLDAFKPVLERFDPVFGGLGQAPKFPQPSLIQYLLRAHERMADAAGADAATFASEPLQLAMLQLRNMARGGIYDQLGGGFARYSTDERWLVPHFEKMLYDNAQLLRVYAEAYQLRQDPLFARVMRETVAYAMRDLSHPEGGFHSAEDADSEGVEGKFYVWTREELEGIFGDSRGPGSDFDLFCRAYDVTGAGNWVDPHHDTAGLNILNVKLTAEDLADETGEPAERIAERLEKARRMLLQARSRRVRPGRDEKILAGWNGLMIAGLSKAGRALGEPEWIATAARTADFVLARLRREPAAGASSVDTPARPSLARSWKDGDLRGEGGLEDFAFLVDGLVELYQATLDARWLLAARDLHEECLSHFYDPVDGGFWSSAPGRTDLISRQKGIDDGALPSAAAVAALNSLRLGRIFERDDWTEVATEVVRAYGGMLARHPVGVTTLLGVFDWLVTGGREVVLAGAAGASGAFAEMRRVLDSRFLPRTLVVAADAGSEIPLAKGKTPVGGKPAAYVCENRACQAPVTDVAALRRQLGLAG